MNAATPPDPLQREEALRWLAQADEDMRAAEVLAAAVLPVLGAAAFHCQQAAEKMAKAVLIAHATPPPRLHDIRPLAIAVAAVEPDIGRALEALAGIGGWYVAVRYPDAGASAAPGIDDIREVLSRLHSLRERVGDVAGGSGR